MRLIVEAEAQPRAWFKAAQAGQFHGVSLADEVADAARQRLQLCGRFGLGYCFLGGNPRR